MGGSSSKEEEKNKNKNKESDNNFSQKEKMEIKRTNTPQIKKEEENIINKDIPIKIIKRVSEPIKQKNNIEKIGLLEEINKKNKEEKKDNNLEITDYFNPYNINSNEINIINNIRQRYNQIIYEINNQMIKYDDNLKNKEINSLFGLEKSIKDDFNRTKTNILFCSSLNIDDEKFINRLDYEQYIKDENNYRKMIINIIKNNRKQFISNVNNLNEK